MVTRLQQPDKAARKRRTRKLLLLLLLLLIAAGAVLWALFLRQEDVLTPDRAPRREDKYAQSIEGEDGDKLPQTGGGAVILTCNPEVGIDLTAGTASIYFANPARSGMDIVLQLAAEDGTVLAQSGRLSPGRQLETLDLLDGAAAQLSPGICTGKFVVLYYRQDTHERSIVNTEIPVSITVA